VAWFASAHEASGADYPPLLTQEQLGCSGRGRRAAPGGQRRPGELEGRRLRRPHHQEVDSALQGALGLRAAEDTRPLRPRAGTSPAARSAPRPRGSRRRSPSMAASSHFSCSSTWTEAARSSSFTIRVRPAALPKVLARRRIRSPG
jgi:hypothetical protein